MPQSPMPAEPSYVEKSRVNFRLREITPADLPRLFEFQSDPGANRMAAVVPRTWEKFEAHWNKGLANPAITTRGILLNEQLIGQITCFQADGKSWIGYWIERGHWGRGCATKALALMLEQVSVRPLHARVAVHNSASLRVLQKCGFAEQHRGMSAGDERFLACEEVILVLS